MRSDPAGRQGRKRVYMIAQPPVRANGGNAARETVQGALFVLAVLAALYSDAIIGALTGWW